MRFCILVPRLQEILSSYAFRVWPTGSDVGLPNAESYGFYGRELRCRAKALDTRLSILRHLLRILRPFPKTIILALVQWPIYAANGPPIGRALIGKLLFSTASFALDRHVGVVGAVNEMRHWPISHVGGRLR